MSEEKVLSLKPFLSLLLIIFTLMGVVFVKMEERRMGYTVLRQTREFKQKRDRHRQLVMEYAKITRPERVRAMAMSRLTMNSARAGQIIQLTGDNIAVAH